MYRKAKSIPVLLLFLFLLIGCSAPSAQPQSVPAVKSAEEQQNIIPQYIVTRAIDGDTIEVTLKGETESQTVRLIGIDTPETVHPNKEIEPYGKEASDFTKSKLEGKTVNLELDTQETDKYGRLLAYV